MARACSIPQRERYTRMALGAGFVLGGFLIRRDVFTAVTMVTVGSAMTARAALGY
jgi:hypothetical protein